MENILNDINKSIIKNNLTLDKDYSIIMNEFFERTFNNIVREIYDNDYDRFLKSLNEITLKYTIPNNSPEVRNLFIIKKMIMDIYNYELHNKPFFCYCSHPIDDYIDVKVTWVSNVISDEKLPNIMLVIRKDIFTQDFNKWCGSPIVMDEFGNIKLFEPFEDKNFNRDKAYFDKLDSAAFGSYLRNFTNTFESIRFLTKIIEDKLNEYRCS